MLVPNREMVILNLLNLSMLHNRSTLIMVAIAAFGYFLYTRLNAEDKQEILNDLRQKTNDIVEDYLASESTASQNLASGY